MIMSSYAHGHKEETKRDSLSRLGEGAGDKIDEEKRYLTKQCQRWRTSTCNHSQSNTQGLI